MPCRHRRRSRDVSEHTVKALEAARGSPAAHRICRAIGEAGAAALTLAEVAYPVHYMAGLGE